MGRHFRGRVSFAGPMDNLTITLHDLRPAHSGLYACVAVTSDKELLGAGTLLMVTGRNLPCCNCPSQSPKLLFRAHFLQKFLPTHTY